MTRHEHDNSPITLTAQHALTRPVIRLEELPVFGDPIRFASVPSRRHLLQVTT